MDARKIDSIAERYDLVWQRRPNWMLRTRRSVTWLAAVAGLALVGYPLITQDPRAFQSRCVSEPHRLIEKRCSECHDQRWQPLLRLVTASEDFRSVSDKACRQCHSQQTHDHHAQLTLANEPRDCVQCHQEHRGRSLLDLADATCTGCHADLTSHMTAEHTPRIDPSLADWLGHPDFALKRAPEASAAEHLAHAVAAGESQQWQDKTALRFNHRLHLAGDGLPVPPDHPDFGDGTQWKKLVCADCHTTDAAGQFMLPVNYERHCQACHRLDFSPRLSEVRDLPHGNADLVRGVLRQRLSEFLAQHPEALNDPVDRSALPQSPVPEASSDAGNNSADPQAARKWNWIEERLAEMSSFVSQRSQLAESTSPQGLVKRIATGCKFCHSLRDEEQSAAWQVVPPAVPHRWMPQAEFRHAAHAMVRCEDCHHSGTAGQNQPASQSSATSDILLPGKEACVRCHATSGRRPESGSAGTRCVECHRYHGRDHATLIHRIRPNEP